MAMTPYSGDTSVIGKLGTTPQERGLTTQQFKDKFDEGLKDFVEWFNDTHKSEIDALEPEQLKDMNGYIKLSGGIIFQWAQVNFTSTTITSSFPMPFPNACLGCMIAPEGELYKVAVGAASNTGVTLYSEFSDKWAIIYAIGY